MQEVDSPHPHQEQRIMTNQNDPNTKPNPGQNDPGQDPNRKGQEGQRQPGQGDDKKQPGGGQDQNR
jgi:hypothetical protein